MKKRNISKKRKKILFGFTLIELLVVLGILAILLSITLLAVEPAEQLNKSDDISKKALATDFSTASVQYYVTKHSLPWDNNVACQNELNAGGTLAQMPDCISELTNGGQLDKTYKNSSELADMYMSKCGDSAVVCYSPKSKVINEDAETQYDKFGVNNPGCPGHNGVDASCYWCKPVMRTQSCTGNITPTPTSAVPTITLTPTPSIPQVLPGYANDQSKFFKTYAAYFFDYPGFDPPAGGWNLQLSLNPDFSGDWTQTNMSFGIPSQYGPQGPANASYTAYRKITMKYVGFASTPSNTGVYDLSNCGKTLYYRIANYYSNTATNKLVGPTYTGKFDCTTKVGVVDPPLSWYTVYDQVNGVQKQYDPSWDFDHSGAIDWVDYWLGAFSTKTRYGGWQPPE